MKRDVVLRLKKITKGAVQHEEIELNGVKHPENASQDDKLIGSMYLRKKHLEGSPQEIHVTVETEG